MKSLFVTSLLSASLLLPSLSAALTLNFSHPDYLGGASWGTMEVSVLNPSVLQIRYDASSALPAGSQVTGFGLTLAQPNPFDSSLLSVTNPAAGDFTFDRDNLNWVALTNLNAIPTPANSAEFDPALAKSFFNFGATEGNAKNFTPPGILPGQSDVFFINFALNGFDLNAWALSDLVTLAGIRLQSLPDAINEGSLFLAGKPEAPAPVPEPTTLVLIGAGLAAMAVGRKLRP